MPDAIIPAFQDDIEENPLVVDTDENPAYLADRNELADEEALQIPLDEGTEDDFPATSSDESEEELD
ncbi:hypothetical protein M5689_024869 [Euphorbia peplus]|nr:hypothetical protein M5689_024869 [Euphorbia peplus]